MKQLVNESGCALHPVASAAAASPAAVLPKEEDNQVAKVQSCQEEEEEEEDRSASASMVEAPLLPAAADPAADSLDPHQKGLGTVAEWLCILEPTVQSLLDDWLIDK